MPGIVRGANTVKQFANWLAEPIAAFSQIEPGAFPINIPQESIPATGLAGAVIGRTAAERDAGTAFGLATTGDTEVYIVLHPSPDPAEAACTVLANNTLIYHELLPGWAALSADVKALVLSRYRCRKYPIESA